MNIKEKSKIVGWDDGPFEFHQDEMVPIVGAVTRGGGRLEGVLTEKIEVDGMNGTSRMVRAVNESKHGTDLSLIMLDGITYGGLNVIDMKALAEKTGLPVIAVTRKEVDFDSFRSALKNLPEFEKRWSAVKNAGEMKKTKIRGSSIFYQRASITRQATEEAISLTATHSTLPEPIRLADLISKAVSGES